MYIDSSNYFIVSSMIFFLVNFDFCFNMELEIFFVNYFVVQWRLSSTIALCLMAF